MQEREGGTSFFVACEGLCFVLIVKRKSSLTYMGMSSRQIESVRLEFWDIVNMRGRD